MKLGVITDIQYADADAPEFAKHRKYRLSLKKLAEAIEFFNTQDLTCIVNLGDTVDWGLENYKPVLQILQASKHPVYHALGNHDFYTTWPSNENRLALQEVLDVLGLDNNYYDVEIGEYRLIFIDNNEVGIIEHPKGTRKYEEGKQLIEDAKSHNLVNAQNWNGSVSDTQFAWLQQKVAEANQKHQEVIICAHAPIFPEHRENMIGNEKILKLLDENRNIVAFMNGHNHDGNYGEYNGVPCITFKGMVDTEENSYALADFREDSLIITGFNREVSRTLKTRRM